MFPNFRFFNCDLRYWQTRTHCCGHIVAHDVSWAAQTGKHLLRTQNVSEQNQKPFLCPGHKICLHNKCCAGGETGKHLCRQQCVRNNMSSFASTFKVLANEDTLFRTHCCRHKCFPVCPRAQHLLWTHILCPGYKNVSDFVQKHFVSATNVSQFARARKRHE